MVHAFSLAIGMSVLWWLLSGYTIPLILALGAASVIAVVVIALRMDVVDHEGHPIHLSPRFITYLPWLGKEIVSANIDTALAILFPRKRVNPTVIRVPATQVTELGHVIFANSITLTPGTVTLAVDDRVITVHALTRGAAEGLKTGEMDRRCTAVEGAEKAGD